MFKVTTGAAASLARRLPVDPAASQTFRFVREEHGWRLQLGHVSDGDTIIRHQGRPILAVDSAVAGGLADRTLRLKGTAERGHLHLGRRSV